MFRKMLFGIFICSGLLISCESSIKKANDQKTTGWAIDDNNDSVYLRYDDKGKLESYTTYKNGRKNGLAKKYYKNGNTQFVINYQNGLKEGLTKWYYENGQLYRETLYTDDEPSGIQKKYYENGKPMAEIPYKNGEVIPGLKEYTKSGKLKTIYPELIIRPIDRLAFENTYTVEVFFSEKLKTAMYYKVIRNEEKGWESLIELKKINGKGQDDYYISRGSFMLKKEIYRGEYNTSLGNKYVAEKSFNIAIDN